MSALAEIRAAVAAGDFQQALDLATSSNSTPNQDVLDFIRQSRLCATPVSQYTVALVKDDLDGISDDLWVASTCAEVLVNDVLVMEEIVRVGLRRTDEAAAQVSGRISTPLVDTLGTGSAGALDSFFSANPRLQKLNDARTALLQRQALLRTYATFKPDQPQMTYDSVGPIEIDEDPWAETDEDPAVEATPSTHSSPPFDLRAFLVQPVGVTAVELGARAETGNLIRLVEAHFKAIWPHRFAILDALPTVVHPQDVERLLPAVDAEDVTEKVPDFDGSDDGTPQEGALSALPAHAAPRSAKEVREWYQQRVRLVDSGCGSVDIALAWVQHAISRGITGLDQLGGDLSLLSRLVYNTLGQPHEVATSLQDWQSLSEEDVVRAYLAQSTPDTVADDIRRTVLPYLYVLEARAERIGHREDNLFKRLLHGWILDADLETSLAVFEASKATLSAAERILKSDVDVAKLALARLYGCHALHDWPVMSRIFECLPVWDVSNSDADSDREITSTTLQSLGAFVQPSVDWPEGPGPRDLQLFFEPLPFASLSKALDILDVHLESGEVLERWNVPAPLRWFVQSAFDKGEQRVWAIRMARAAAEQMNPRDRRGTGDGEWTTLLEDMIKLSGGGEGLLRGAFGLMTKEEVLKAFFEGILSAGYFGVAKRLLRSPEVKGNLKPAVIEQVVLAISREFYENADSGNMHSGDMKLAYDCLGVVEPSSAVRKERDFIEATSRIASYQVRTAQGDIMTPLEIRLTKNKLDLISKVLSSSDDAYRHVEIILDLAHKLGYKGDDVAEIQVLAMLTDSAMQKPDFDQAGEICEQIVAVTTRLQRQVQSGKVVPGADDGMAICWKTCSQLGKQSEYSDVPRKMALLGRALQLCPPEEMASLLVVWRNVENGQIRLDEAARNRHEPLIFQKGGHRRRSNGSFSSTASTERVAAAQLLGSKRAAIAAKRLNQVAQGLTTNFNLRPLQASRLGARGGEVSPARSEASDHSPLDALAGLGEGAEIRQQARKALVKGVGWLIGAGEEEMQDA